MKFILTYLFILFCSKGFLFTQTSTYFYADFDLSKFGIKRNDSIIQSPIYDNAWSFNEGIGLVEINSKKGYVDTLGNWLMKPVFSDATTFYDGLAIVKTDALWRFIDVNFNYLFNKSFENECYFRNKRACVNYNGKMGVINLSGDFIIEPIYDLIEDRVEYFLTGDKKKKIKDFLEEMYPPILKGFIFLNRSGNLIVEPKYEELIFQDSIIKAKISDGFWDIYKSGIKINESPIEAEYFLESNIESLLLIKKNNEKLGVFNINKNRWEIEPIFASYEIEKLYNSEDLRNFISLHTKTKVTDRQKLTSFYPENDSVILLKPNGETISSIYYKKIINIDCPHCNTLNYPNHLLRMIDLNGNLHLLKKDFTIEKKRFLPSEPKIYFNYIVFNESQDYLLDLEFNVTDSFPEINYHFKKIEKVWSLGFDSLGNSIDSIYYEFQKSPLLILKNTNNKTAFYDLLDRKLASSWFIRGQDSLKIKDSYFYEPISKANKIYMIENNSKMAIFIPGLNFQTDFKYDFQKSYFIDESTVLVYDLKGNAFILKNDLKLKKMSKNSEYLNTLKPY